ncbi:P-loop containing nucleoside triphosphate hydrolase protein [Lophiotrema nucula]|uniref:P-loop containing nucleoside triphosphate hydrolase protein n=1 Tax=Lophiotrema nucula TaxID=690887 RepID=A0A6A5YIW1_9PLEO|nr:P-loop containing nucleoside triphosphate hydrolase protein [Lophiotrema nucula]
MSSARLIDSTPPNPNAKDVQVLVLGFSRTGTMSLKTALEKLGYTPYHMSEALKNTRYGHLTFWKEALAAKYEGKGKPFGREEFDKFLGGYDVLEDIPCIMFVDELLKAYPGAKVVLTNRDVESWAKSMNNTFFTITEWKTLPYLRKWDTIFWGPYQEILDTIMTQWGKGDRNDRAELQKYYLNHYENVRRQVPKERLLEFESKDGWGPLCEFLGKEAPEEEYPRINDAKNTVRLHSFLYYYRIVKLLRQPFLVGVSVAVGGVAVWWAWKRSFSE